MDVLGSRHFPSNLCHRRINFRRFWSILETTYKRKNWTFGWRLNPKFLFSLLISFLMTFLSLLIWFLCAETGIKLQTMFIETNWIGKWKGGEDYLFQLFPVISNISHNHILFLIFPGIDTFVVCDYVLVRM